MYWYEANSDETNPVISTRVRFARNLEKTPFPESLTPARRREVFEKVKEALADRKTLAVDFAAAPEPVRRTYVQTHLASENLLHSGEGCGLILSADGEISIMVHEEDHIRLQAIESGLKIREAYEKALEWMKLLEEKLPVAFDEKFGYLTACPTNLGAGMRASVMIHLPCLQQTGRMNALIRGLNDAGFTVRGLFGEGSRASGAIYQISNQMSREKSGDEIIAATERITGQVILEEAKARDALLENDRIRMEDSVSRAIGTLQYARKMSYGEFISLYSLIRLGREMGMKEAEILKKPDRLLIELMPAPMILRNAALADADARDAARAQQIREALGEKEE